MASPEKKQHIPVFVGSTFSDLKSYRQETMQALHQLETIVRGMEYFGSKPGSPVNECLAVVQSCKIYVGIFGMRYGSIPDGYNESMTHLEYLEAQRIELPSLIYIINEDEQPVLPIHVDKDENAIKLQNLKSDLKRNHTVSFFTDEKDLSSRISRDILPVLDQIGINFDYSKLKRNGKDTQDFLNKFDLMPKRFSGQEIDIEIEVDSHVYQTSEEDAKALRLSIGDCIHVRGEIQDIEDNAQWDFHAEKETAVKLLAIKEGSKIKCRVVSKFGLKRDIEWSDEGPILKENIVKEFVILSIY